MPGESTLVVANITGLSFVFTSSGLDHPQPYTAYQFTVTAINSVGRVVSEYAMSVETPSSGKDTANL